MEFPRNEEEVRLFAELLRVCTVINTTNLYFRDGTGMRIDYEKKEREEGALSSYFTDLENLLKNE